MLIDFKGRVHNTIKTDCEPKRRTSPKTKSRYQSLFRPLYIACQLKQKLPMDKENLYGF